MSGELPSPSENAAVQEALSIRYVDKIGLAWLPDAQQWAVFSNSGKLVEIFPPDITSNREEFLRNLCMTQDREWRHRLEAELAQQRPGPSVASASAGDLGL